MRFDLLTPRRIAFGRGRAAEAPEALARFGRHLLLVRGRSAAFADALERALRAQGGALRVVQGAGEPTLDQLETALDEARAFAPDAVAAIGGGSILDLGKALAALAPSTRPPLDHLEVVGKGLPLEAAPLPFVAIPTTAGTGAEATKNAVIGVPAEGRKVSLRDERMLPALALVDPALTDACPRPVTLASGLDAITQVIEPYLSARANPVTDALCRPAIPRGLAALIRLMQEEDAPARDDMALVSLTGGIALANAGLGAVHGLAGVLGGRTGAPHGAICGRLLVPVLRTNRSAMQAEGRDLAKIDEVLGAIGEAFGVSGEQALERFAEWIDAAGLPRLAQMTGPALDVTAIARESLASSSMKGNPVPLSQSALAALLAEA